MTTYSGMSRITAIETQKRRGDRKSIFVDGEFVAGAHEEVVVALNLGVGQIFDKDRLVELVRAETVRKARESALRLISYRDRSVSEVRKRLIGDEYPEDIVDEVIEKLSGVGLLDDQKFSHDWVKARTVETSKPMGKTRLAWELRSKGVEAPMVEEALENLDEDAEYQLALSAIARKVEKMDCCDPSSKNRLASFLRRRGFDWEIISKVLDEICSKD